MPPNAAAPAEPAPRLAGTSGDVRNLAVAGLVVGAWAVVPPYVGPALATASRVEFADHVVPAIVIVAIAGFALWSSSRRCDPTLMFLGGLSILLAGFWMTATHVPLVLQARRGGAPWGATVYHSLPGLAVLVVGGLWSAKFWGDEPTGPESPESSPAAAGTDAPGAA